VLAREMAALRDRDAARGTRVFVHAVYRCTEDAGAEVCAAALGVTVVGSTRNVSVVDLLVVPIVRPVAGTWKRSIGFHRDGRHAARCDLQAMNGRRCVYGNVRRHRHACPCGALDQQRKNGSDGKQAIHVAGLSVDENAMDGSAPAV
jgi:hypothetical protein